MKADHIIWLAGFIDADGCIRLSKGWKNKKGQNCLVPQILIHNTSFRTMEFVAEVITSIIPAFNVTWKKLKSRKHSQLVSIHIEGIKRAEPFLSAIEPYLVTKKLEAQLLQEFIKTRYTGKGKFHQSYSDKEYKIYFALKHLKKTRNLRDYTPNVEEILNEDIVRTNAKSLEETEMFSRLTEEQRKEWKRKLLNGEYRSGLKK